MSTGILCLRHLQAHFKASGFSTLVRIAEDLLGDFYLDLLQSTLFFKNSYSTITSLRDFFKSYGISAFSNLRQWSVDFTSHILFSALIYLNPKLTATQQSQLSVIMSRAMEQLLARGFLEEQVMQGIVTLASPDQGTCLLLSYLIEALAAISCYITSTDQPGKESDTDSSEEEDDRQISTLLVKNFGIERVFVAAMSAGVRKSVWDALTSSSSSSTDNPPATTPFSSPICCITLEPLLWPDYTITMDVVAVIQRRHAFLYRGCALYDWLGTPYHLPTNPHTRSIVKPTDVYRLS